MVSQNQCQKIAVGDKVRELISPVTSDALFFNW